MATGAVVTTEKAREIGAPFPTAQKLLDDDVDLAGQEAVQERYQGALKWGE